MAILYKPNSLSLTFLLLLISLLASVQASRPGFVYTRATGKCTPKYWSSSRREAWPRMIPQKATVAKVFGSRAGERFRSDLTVMEATAGSERGDAYRGVLKQASAALLNAYARRTGFPYTPWAVKTLLIGALVSEEAASRQAYQFALANEACV